MKPTSVLLPLSFLASYASAKLGINCQGSQLCHKGNGDLVDYVNHIDCNRMYENGEHIACINRGHKILGKQPGMCLFLQYATQPISGATIQGLLGQIIAHGCEGCGSVPLSYLPEFGLINNPDAGILTLNYLSDTANPCDPGLC